MQERVDFTLIPGFLGGAGDYDTLIRHLGLKAQILELPETSLQLCAKGLSESAASNILIGYSMGGRLALLTGALYPERVDHVIAISTQPGIAETEKEARIVWEQQWLKTLAERSLDDFLKLWYDQPLFAGLKRSDEFETMWQRRKKIDRERAHWHFKNFALSEQPNLWHELKTYRPRLSFIFGEDDVKYREIHERLIEMGLSSYRLSSGHAPHLENPEALASLIRQLIR